MNSWSFPWNQYSTFFEYYTNPVDGMACRYVTVINTNINANDTFDRQ